MNERLAAVVLGPLVVVAGIVVMFNRHALSGWFQRVNRTTRTGEAGDCRARRQTPGLMIAVGGFFAILGALLLVVVGVLDIPI